MCRGKSWSSCRCWGEVPALKCIVREGAPRGGKGRKPGWSLCLVARALVMRRTRC